MRLLLTSMGIDNSFKSDFLTLLGKGPKDVSVLHVITAALVERPPYFWVDRAKDQLANCGIGPGEDVDIAGKTEAELRSVVLEKDIIVIHGGNTFYLLDQVRKTRFDVVLNNAILKEGKLYIGVSAGSILPTPSIETAGWYPPDENTPGLTNLKGLGWVDFVIHPHFTDDQKEQVENEVATTRYPAAILYDSQAALVSNNTIKVVGEGKKNFYNGFSEKV